jgi:hypothetical protein
VANGSDVLVERLLAWGVDAIFGLRTFSSLECWKRERSTCFNWMRPGAMDSWGSGRSPKGKDAERFTA